MINTKQTLLLQGIVHYLELSIYHFNYTGKNIEEKL